jgi:outer membrane receptor protein involved in Fe transport
VKPKNRVLLCSVILSALNTAGVLMPNTRAAELNTNIPQQEDAILNTKVTLNLPAQPLGAALKSLGEKIDLNITFNDALVSGKNAPVLNGTMSRKEALQRLLSNTGLEAKLNDTTLYIQRTEQKSEDTAINLKQVDVRAKRFYEVGPLPGLGLTKEEIPGNVQSISAKEIKESHSLSLADLMNSKLQSVSVNDYQGNPFQMDVNYRGFTASPQLGTAQGISVFFDGIRINEPFGDVVNWDMIPMNALTSLDVFPGSNPIFGLGTLGGALSMRTKSGFDGQSLDAEVLAGSYGRKQLQISAGGNNGVIAGFVSGNFFLEDAWRDDSPSRVNQVFGKAEWQNERARLGLSMLYAGNKLTGNGLLPEQMAAVDRSQIYTSPDESKNDLLQFQLNGIWDVTDTFNITGQIYNRKSKRKSSMADVNENFGGLESGPGVATTRDPNRQVLFGLPDINRDGKPDYNNYAYNIAADASGRALDVNGIAYGDPGFDINNLAYGTSFSTQANVNQAQVTANDGSGNTIWSWVADPRQFDDFAGPNGELVASSLPNTFNAPVSAQYDQIVRYAFDNRGLLNATNYLNSTVSEQINSSIPHPGNGSSIHSYDIVGTGGMQGVIGSYTDDAGFFHDYFELFTPINLATQAYILSPIRSVYNNSGVIVPAVVDANGDVIYRDGKYGGVPTRGTTTGYIEGTPTAIFTDTQIDQVGTGGSLQLNWNLEQHKFMVGTSIDKSDSTYESKQYLGFLDDKRHGFVAPELMAWEFYANSPERAIALNDFSGNAITKSIYASETWSPTKTLNFTAAARFNHSIVDNQLAVNRISSFGDVNRILNILNTTTLCTDDNNDGVIDPNTECPNGLGNNIVQFDESYANMDGLGQGIASLRPPEKEKFKYRSFNPSLGATWQAREDLNLYGNWSRGARTPTVIELGCAYDPTPLSDGRPRSLAEQRVCNLPGALSGDPYLKQVRSNSMELGARGSLTEDLEWNASIYRTDLKDDIYFVAVNATSSYFQNIGDTRRQGFEMGLKGKAGKARFGLNYSLTDATFQSPMEILSAHNSSAANVYDINSFTEQGSFGKIKVKPGNRMPGIPLHNLNANFSYEVTDKWTVGLNAVMHSSAFVRGNENNKHRAGPAAPLIGPFCSDPISGVSGLQCSVERADFGSGKTAGYTVFNLRSSYRITPEWTFGMQINNLFDKEYASAGRLGVNAFSPSIRGAIGTGGFNYNSADWQGTSFLGLGAPRSAYFTLSYQFMPDK